MSFIPKKVLITGATGDFGKAFARRFADVGSALVLHGRSPEKLEALKSEFPDAETVCFDLCDQTAIQSALADVKGVDLLINNAGGALGNASADESDLDDWLKMIEMNNTSLVTITHMILKGMREQGRGHIINIGSISGTYPYPGGHVYCAVKAFTKQFSLALRADLFAKNIRVTNIEPGMVETQFSLARFKGDKERADAVYANTDPLTAEDIAESVFWSATLPPHCNINTLEIMPTRQAPAGLVVDRD